MEAEFKALETRSCILSTRPRICVSILRSHDHPVSQYDSLSTVFAVGIAVGKSFCRQRDSFQPGHIPAEDRIDAPGLFSFERAGRL